MKPLYQHQHNQLIKNGDRSRIKTCKVCEEEIDDSQDYCSDECLSKYEKENTGLESE